MFDVFRSPIWSVSRLLRPYPISILQSFWASYGFDLHIITWLFNIRFGSLNIWRRVWKLVCHRLLLCISGLVGNPSFTAELKSGACSQLRRWWPSHVIMLLIWNDWLTMTDTTHVWLHLAVEVGILADAHLCYCSSSSEAFERSKYVAAKVTAKVYTSYVWKEVNWIYIKESRCSNSLRISRTKF